MNNIIEIRKLTFEYSVYDEHGEVSGKKRALNEISLDVPEGQFLAVLGSNGSGKSTLAKHLNGILLPAGGTVTVCGFDVSNDETLLDLRKNVGMVFQNPDNQIVATIVEDDVAFALENLGVPPAEIRSRVDRALADVGMTKYALHAPHHLSGGQKQRVAIAGVLAISPRVIVLDEPTAMLDPRGRREVINTVRKLNKTGITIILITHYMEEAVFADRVIIMNKGVIYRDVSQNNAQYDGTPREIFTHGDRLRQIGLTVPPVTELAVLLNDKGLDVPRDIITEEECVDKLNALLKNAPPPDNIQSENDTLIQSENAVSQSENPVIEVSGLTYKYSRKTPFEVTAVNNISFKIYKGEFIGVMGHTGSGKSTAIQHLNGLLKPTSGQVLINSRDIWALKSEQKKGRKSNQNSDKKDNLTIKDIRFEVGLVFQYSEHQLFEETVYKDIAFGPRNMGLSETEIKERVLSAAEVMGVHESWLKSSPFDLSGGQKRRVALAGVIAMKPNILILDEPAAGLDPRGREQVLDRIRAHQRQSGVTVMLVSHSMDDIVKYAARVLVMNGGEIFCFAGIDNVFRQARKIEEIGLDVPQITRVCSRLDYALPGNIYTAERAAEHILRAVNAR